MTLWPIDEVLVMVDPNAAEDYYYAHNHLYSPTALLDDAGAIIERYDYDAYGRPYFMEPNFVLSQTQKSNYRNTYLFTGRTVDFLDNGKLTLQYSRNRYYDYHTGRWLTKDPIGYRDGMNIYQYVRSNPVVYQDPFGLLYEIQWEWWEWDEEEKTRIEEQFLEIQRQMIFRWIEAFTELIILSDDNCYDDLRQEIKGELKVN